MSELIVMPAHCERMLLMILRELGIPSGGRVLNTTLESEWKKLGLREADFHTGLDGLTRKKQLRQYDYEAMELTVAGQRRMHSMRLSEIAGSLSARRVLTRAAEQAREDADAAQAVDSAESSQAVLSNSRGSSNVE